MTKLNGRLVVLGMSGGVDSSVSLMLLKQAGYDVAGVSLRYDIWECADRSENVCCSKESFETAKKVCEHFGCEHKTIDVSDQFKKEVIDYFKSELEKNRTPSPCVFCNPKVKFKSLLEYADKIGAQFVATGHYAKVEKINDQFELHRAKYLEKDQTYSLSFLSQNQLSRVIFLLGEISKSEVYDLAKQNEVLKIYENVKQSQDFCFLGRDQLNEFIAKEIKPEPGRIVELDGSAIGEHKGLPYYTIGQRKGIELAGGPYYVVGKDIAKNELVVSKNPKDMAANGVVLNPYNLINQIEMPIKIKTKLRSAQDLFDAELDLKKDKLVLKFESPQPAVTLGQVAVFYKNDQCLGSGVIDNIVS